MNHPTYPLRDEQARAVQRLLKSGGTMRAIRATVARFEDYRDAEFPGWRQQYEHLAMDWLKARAQELNRRIAGL